MAADTTTLLILGASGDLTSRLLLPALGQLLVREPGRSIHLRGAGMEDLTDEAWRAIVRSSFATTDSAAAFAAVAATTYTQADIPAFDHQTPRSEHRRVGKECISTC